MGTGKNNRAGIREITCTCDDGSNERQTGKRTETVEKRQASHLKKKIVARSGIPLDMVVTKLVLPPVLGVQPPLQTTLSVLNASPLHTKVGLMKSEIML